MPTRDCEIAVLPFSVDDDSAVSWAVQQFAPASELLVVHPYHDGVSASELEEVRSRLASHFKGQYQVSSRRDGRPSLHFLELPR